MLHRQYYLLNFGCNEPRLATLRSKRAAKSKPLVTYTNAELGFAAEEVGIKGSPTVTVDSFQPETKRSARDAYRYTGRTCKTAL